MESLESRRLLSATMVADILDGLGGGSPQHLTAVADTLYFSANNGTSGLELWKSDGTTDGTEMVKDINPGSAESGPLHLTNVDGTLYFTADDGEHGVELWKSDGTIDGTKMVSDINPDESDSHPENLTVIGDKLYFIANNGINGTELWVSDGTEAGTKMIKDINVGGGSSFPNAMISIDDQLYFAADDGNSGAELWTSDGTESGTHMVKDIAGGFQGSGPGNLIDTNGTFFFTAYTNFTGYELWKSDGTADGTEMVRDIFPGSVGSNPHTLTYVNGTLFFIADTESGGSELWKSDGTTDGTEMAKDIYIGSAGSGVYDLINADGTLYFQANDGINGHELWKSDGTGAGTVMVKNINPGVVGSNPEGLTNVDGTIYFSADDGTHGNELWQTDGTADGTVIAADVNSGLMDSDPSNLTNVNGQLYFTAYGQASGIELWKLSPIGAVAGDYIVNEGGSVQLSAAGTTWTQGDPATLTYKWDLDGDGIYGETGDAAAHGDEAGMTPTFVAGNLNGPGTQAISLKITDNDDNSSTASGTITIDNVVPTIAPIETITGYKGKEVEFTATFIDPGPETHTAAIDWGDGTSEPMEVIQNDGGGSVSASHVYEEEGEYWPVLNVSDGSVPEARHRFTIIIKKEAPPVLPVGDQPGDGSQVHVQRTDGTELEITAFDGFQGGVNVASGDVNGDGVADIIAAAGTGGSSHIRIFNGDTGEQIDSPLGSFVAFAGAGGSVADPSSTYWTGAYNGPVQVAGGDFNGDGVADLVVAAGAGGSSHVKIFNGADGSLMQSFLAFGGGTDAADPAYFANAFQGGVNVSTGDIDGDGLADLIVGAGPGAGPHVKVFADGDPARLIRSFFAYDAGFTGGVNVAGGDVNGDGRDDILTAPQSNAGPHVVAFSGIDQSLLQSFWAFDPTYTGGVTLGGGDYNADGFFDLYATQTGGAGESRLYDFSSGAPQQKAVADFFNIV